MPPVPLGIHAHRRPRSGAARDAARAAARRAVALAAWDAPEHNPWATVPTDELLARGLTERRDPAQPGMFAFSPPGRLESLLQDAGFTEVEVDAVEIQYRFDSADAYLDTILDMSVPFADAVAALGEEERDAVLAAHPCAPGALHEQRRRGPPSMRTIGSPRRPR